jgi:Kef-type K+ transport system membrane component KefB
LLGQPVHSFISHKSWAIGFPDSKGVTLAATVLLVASLAGLSYWSYRLSQSAIDRQPRPNPALGCLAALLLFVLLFKVGSPQYIISAFAVGAVAAQRFGKRDRLKLTLRFLAISLAIYCSFANYTELINLQDRAMAFVVIRYTLLVELLIWTIRKLHASMAQPE